jgi:hypothetical protein
VIRVIIEFDLRCPFRQSLDTLLAFCSVWDSTVLYGGTCREQARITMPSRHFKRIFGMNPQVTEYKVPAGMEKFVTSCRVAKIEAK